MVSDQHEEPAASGLPLTPFTPTLNQPSKNYQRDLRQESPSVSLALLTDEQEQQVVEHLRESRARIDSELSKTIVGQKDVVQQLLISLLAGGHCLITGAPGLAKTLLVRSVAQIFHLKFQRIQFTPDLMPSDITGTEILEQRDDGRRELQFIQGAVFANVILADEINRTPPKTQAALLEAMQEHQVTVAGKRYVLEEPFFVLATQNPIEMEGTYPLPEAQLDRFMFNVLIDYLPHDEELEVVLQTTARRPEPIEQLFSGEDVLKFQEVVRRVPIARETADYAVRLVEATRPGRPEATSFVNEWVSWGAGLRAAQTLVLGSKARALLEGRSHASIDDIRALAAPALRHRVLLNYKAEAEGVTVEDCVASLLKSISPQCK